MFFKRKRKCRNPELEAYIEKNYVPIEPMPVEMKAMPVETKAMPVEAKAMPMAAAMPFARCYSEADARADKVYANKACADKELDEIYANKACVEDDKIVGFNETVKFDESDEIVVLEQKLSARLEHLSDTFSQYLLYLIQSKGMKNADVYKRAIVDKKTFSKIKNNIDYHPQKLTALCLCIGAKLNLDETKDLLARAGYALSPCDMTDVIFSFFIENGHYDVVDIDIQLEIHGCPCIIS